MGGAYVNVRPYYPFPRIRTNSSHVLRTSWHPHSWIRGTNGQDTPQIMTKKLLEDFWNKLSSLNEFLLEKISSCIEEFYLAVKEKKKKERKNGKSVPSLFSCSPIFFRERKFLCSENRRINISTLLIILLPSSSLIPKSNSPQRVTFETDLTFQSTSYCIGGMEKSWNSISIYRKTGKGNLCPLFICGMAQWPPPNIYFFRADGQPEWRR